MKVRVEGEMLAVVVLVFSSIVCNGLILDKCDLKTKLMSSLTVKAPDQARRVTELTCHSEITTGFNTSAINQLPPLVNDHGTRKRRHVRQNSRPNAAPARPAVTPSRNATARPQPATTSRPVTTRSSTPRPSTRPSIGATSNRPTPQGPGPLFHNDTSDHPNLSENMMPGSPSNAPPSSEMQPGSPNGAPPRGGMQPGSPNGALPSGEMQPGFPTGAPASGGMEPDMQPFNLSAFTPSRFNVTSLNPRPARSPVQMWTLYGIFQLSDHVACTSNNIPSLNLCGLSCDQLLDDDITDDIDCVNTIFSSFRKLSNPQEQHLLGKMMSLLMSKECADVKYANYFSSC